MTPQTESGLYVPTGEVWLCFEQPLGDGGIPEGEPASVGHRFGTRGDAKALADELNAVERRYSQPSAKYYAERVA